MCNEADRKLVGVEIAASYVDIMTDKRGNYVCQKYFTFCDTVGRLEVWSRLVCVVFFPCYVFTFFFFFFLLFFLLLLLLPVSLFFSSALSLSS